MRGSRILFAGLLLALVPITAGAQIGVPGVTAPRLDDLTARIGIDPTAVLPTDIDQLPARQVGRLLNSTRIERLKLFQRDNREFIEMDRNDDPAVRGVVLATGLNEKGVSDAIDAGYRVLSRETIEPFGLEIVKLGVPDKMKLSRALRNIRKIAPDAEFEADHIYFQSGAAVAQISSIGLAGGLSGSASLGLIDGGVGAHEAIGPVKQRGFAKGAPKASSHGTAVAALMSGTSPIASAAPGNALVVADIYGADPAGGNATALMRALGWMAQNEVAVVNVSLVGPENALVHRAIKAAQGTGMVIVAAVGNDGPAAPPSYPASYLGVIAVTGVDARGKLLPEAGRPKQTDFSAPGKDIFSAGLSGDRIAVRGTSFAAPLVSGTLVRHYSRPDRGKLRAAVNALVGEAQDLGKKGYDKSFGHGVVCRQCGK